MFGLGFTSGGGGGGGGTAGWVRPSDWPSMPTTQTNEVDVLVAVSNNDSNYCAVSVTVTGGYTVDWGDTTVENVASGVQRDHKYTYSTLSSSVTSRGYKTAMIRLYPQGANNITSFNLGLKNGTAGLAAYSNPWLDIQVNAPSATTMSYRGGVDARWVERINIIAIGAVSSLLNTFANCVNLHTVLFPVGSLTAVTSLSSAFTGCSSIMTVAFPVGSLASVNTLASAFLNCSSLESVTWPDGSLASVTTLSSAFSGCNSLLSMTFPSGALVSTTSLSSAFLNCLSLQTVAFPSGSLGNLTDITSVFNGCNALILVTLPASGLANLTTTTNAFASTTNLERIINCTVPVTFTLPCNLSSTELNEIYTSLPSVTAKTLTASGNYGFAGSTQSIATGKGWTLA